PPHSGQPIPLHSRPLLLNRAVTELPTSAVLAVSLSVLACPYDEPTCPQSPITSWKATDKEAGLTPMLASSSVNAGAEVPAPTITWF
ncbi:hypothetical protein PoB_000988300, partial [Plakobranchus ocellatus]